MKKRTCAAVAAVSVLLSAIITFQITSTTYRAKNKAELDSLKTEYESSFGGKMNALHDDFLSLYNGDVDEEQLDELSMKYFVFATGDRYGEYLTADEFAELEAGLEGDFVGIGVSVIEDSDSGLLEVVDVFPDSPAASVGMQPGDLIYKVGDDYAAEIGEDAVLSRVRGEEGTSVTLTVLRDGEEQTFTVARAHVTERNVMYRMYGEQGGEASNVGLIIISSFDAVTESQVDEAIAALRERGAEALIFDLRGNLGGALTSIVPILDKLLPEGPILHVVPKVGDTETISSDAEELDMPMAVVVNGNTASAAELFTSALMDYGKAVIVGTQTYGKGCMQTITQRPDGSAIRVTTAYYDPPYSENYDGVGITPDIVAEPDDVTSSTNRYRIADRDDNQLTAAYNSLIN